MANDGADVTCRGRAFQILEAATGKARSPTVDNRVRRTVSDGDEAERKRRRASVSSESELVGEVRWCYRLPALVDKESQLVVNPLRRLQPVQLTEERGDVLVP